VSLSTEGAKPARRRLDVRQIILLVVVVYVLILFALNTDRVQIDFLFFSHRTSLFLALLLAAALGFLAGYLTRRSRARRG
jgi:uncharacterized integral membrane protein